MQRNPLDPKTEYDRSAKQPPGRSAEEEPKASPQDLEDPIWPGLASDLELLRSEDPDLYLPRYLEYADHPKQHFQPGYKTPSPRAEDARPGVAPTNDSRAQISEQSADSSAQGRTVRSNPGASPLSWGQRFFNESLDRDSVYGMTAAAAELSRRLEARSLGFELIRDGDYFRIKGKNGLNAPLGIPAGRIATKNLGKSTRAGVRNLAKVVHMPTAIKSGARGGMGLSALGTTFDYWMDPAKSFDQSFWIDVGFDVVKGGISGAAGSLVGAGLAGAAMGSWAPVVGTVVGFGVGVGVAALVEYAVFEDAREYLKSLEFGDTE
jgi:hypothetical protein